MNESNIKENQMNMNRRMFFKSMGAATVAAAPISSALANVVSPKKWDQTCEVLVVQSINTLSIKQMRTRCLQASISSGRSPVPHSLA